MKPREIKGARVRLGYSQKFVADKLEMNYHSYRKKESGEVQFTDEDKIALARLLELSPVQMNDYLYDGKLPIGNDGIAAWQQ